MTRRERAHPSTIRDGAAGGLVKKPATYSSRISQAQIQTCRPAPLCLGGSMVIPLQASARRLIRRFGRCRGQVSPFTPLCGTVRSAGTATGPSRGPYVEGSDGRGDAPADADGDRLLETLPTRTARASPRDSMESLSVIKSIVGRVRRSTTPTTGTSPPRTIRLRQREPDSRSSALTRRGAAIGEFRRRPTLMFNGYGDQVASLYAGMDLRANY